MEERPAATSLSPPAEIVANLWRSATGDAAALDCLKLTGSEPVLPSSFRIGVAAQASIAAAGLAAAELRHGAGAPRQLVDVDMRHAAIEFRSEHYLTIDGEAPALLRRPAVRRLPRRRWRFVRLHMNFRTTARTSSSSSAVRRRARRSRKRSKTWDAVAFETAAYEHGCVVAAMRSPAEWGEHPQAAAVAASPVVRIERIGEAPPRPLPTGARSLRGCASSI